MTNLLAGSGTQAGKETEGREADGQGVVIPKTSSEGDLLQTNMAALR